MFLFLFCSVSYLAICQKPQIQAISNLSFHEESDAAFEPLDKSQIPTRILYDRVYPLSRLANFNQGSVDTSSNNHFRQVYDELYSYLSANYLKYEDLSALITQKKQSAITPIGVIYTKFNIIKPDAIQKNLLRLENGKYYDVVGRTESPYAEKRAFVAALLTEKIYTGLNCFQLPDFLAMAEGFSFIRVDFGEGNPIIEMRVIDSPVQINYGIPGTKLIKFTVGFTNGTTSQTNALLKVEANPTRSTACSSTTYSIESTIPYVGYNESSSVNPYARGEVTVYFGANNCSDRKIRKPIIVIDGFDSFWDMAFMLEYMPHLVTEIAVL